MAATTLPKRQPKHHSGGGNHLAKPYGILIAGGAVFILTWMIWTFWFSSALPK